MSNLTPSTAGVKSTSTGLELKRNPQTNIPAPEDKITTQHPNTPPTSNRGYA